MLLFLNGFSVVILHFPLPKILVMRFLLMKTVWRMGGWIPLETT